MNRIQVVRPGLQTTVQDVGRFGYAADGVSASGAADALALRAGNLLVGNAENAPALEMTLVGGTFVFENDAVVALTGSDFQSGLPLWKSVEVRAGTEIRCRAASSGARGYLAVRGGIHVPLVLGSASTHVLTGIGGRALQAGDSLSIGEAQIRQPRSNGIHPPEKYAGVLRVTAGPQASWFSDAWLDAVYQVTEDSNRMGLRLRGPAIPSPAGHMLTEGVTLGAVQVPPDGQPILLFVEHQTTGGYPKPANVIAADLRLVGQLRPRDDVRFERVSIEEALRALQAQEEWLYSLI